MNCWSRCLLRLWDFYLYLLPHKEMPADQHDMDMFLMDADLIYFEREDLPTDDEDEHED